MTMSPIIEALEPALLRSAFSAFPSGVVAVAAEVEGRTVGLEASSFTSVSLDPPLVSFAVANSSATWPTLRRSSHLGLSVLADHHDRACRQLAGPAADRFVGLETATTPEGAVLLEEAVVSFDCSVHREVLAGDHTIVLLRLHGVSDPGDDQPLVFHRSGFGRLADTA